MRDAPQLLKHDARKLYDVVFVRIRLYAEIVEKLVQLDVARHLDRTVAQRSERLHHPVVLVPYVADQLLQNVLERHDAQCAAELVDDDREMRLFLLQLAKQSADLHRRRRIDQIVRDRAVYLLRSGEICLVEVLLVEQPDHIVDRVLVDRQTRVARLAEDVEHAVHVLTLAHRRHVHARRQYVLDGQIVKLDRRADELALVLVDAALRLSLVDIGDQLVVGDRRVFLGFEHLVEQLAPKPEQPCQRKTDDAYSLCVPHKDRRRLFGVSASEHPRSDLTENEHQRYHRERRNDHCERNAVLDHLHEQQHAEHRRNDICDVVADEQRGQQPVLFFGHGEHALCLFVAVLRGGLELDFVQRRIRLLHRRKERREDEHDHDKYGI